MNVESRSGFIGGEVFDRLQQINQEIGDLPSAGPLEREKIQGIAANIEKVAEQAKHVSSLDGLLMIQKGVKEITESLKSEKVQQTFQRSVAPAKADKEPVVDAKKMVEAAS